MLIKSILSSLTVCGVFVLGAHQFPFSIAAQNQQQVPKQTPPKQQTPKTPSAPKPASPKPSMPPQQQAPKPSAAPKSKTPKSNPVPASPTPPNERTPQRRDPTRNSSTPSNQQRAKPRTGPKAVLNDVSDDENTYFKDDDTENPPGSYPGQEEDDASEQDLYDDPEDYGEDFLSKT